MFLMSHRASLLACGVAVIASALWASGASADEPPDANGTPKQIDQTPPLVPIPNARVSPMGLLVGGQPTQAQLRAIQEAGYRMVVSLRAHTEPGDEGEPALVERLGMKFVSIPVDGAPGLTEQNARSLHKTLSGEDVLPAVVHCRTGERTAALLGLRAFVVDRVQPEAAVDVAKGLGMKKLEAALRQRLQEICQADASRNCEGWK